MSLTTSLLFQAQGLNQKNGHHQNGDAPKVQKHTTMMNTVKEGESLLDGQVDPDAKTRSQQHQIDEANDEAPKVAKVRRSLRKGVGEMHASFI